MMSRSISWKQWNPAVRMPIARELSSTPLHASALGVELRLESWRDSVSMVERDARLTHCPRVTSCCTNTITHQERYLQLWLRSQQTKEGKMRTGERRVGKEWVTKCKYRRSPE